MAFDITPFYVHHRIKAQVAQLHLQSKNETIVLRCIGGYSNPTGYYDRIAKIKYRLEQYWNSYPDWNKSCKKIGTELPGVSVGDPLVDEYLDTIADVYGATAKAGAEKLNNWIATNNTLQRV